MKAVQIWFAQLAKKEQYLLLFLAVVVFFYLSYVLGYKSLQTDYTRYHNLTISTQQTLNDIELSVQQIQVLRKGGHQGGAADGQSLAQLVEMAAGRADIRINRFSPNGDNEAQVWFERISFSQLLDCLSALELDYGIAINSMAVNAVNAPGLVNARIKLSR